MNVRHGMVAAAALLAGCGGGAASTVGTGTTTPSGGNPLPTLGCHTNGGEADLPVTAVAP